MSPAAPRFRFVGATLALLLLGAFLTGCAHGRFWGVKHGGEAPRFGADVTIPLGKK